MVGRQADRILLQDVIMNILSVKPSIVLMNLTQCELTKLETI